MTRHRLRVKDLRKDRGPADRTVPASENIAKLTMNPHQGKGELRFFGGAQHDEWNQRLAAQIAGSLPEARGNITATVLENSTSALSGQIGINPQDPIEGMLGAQMLAANAAALDLYRRAWVPEQSFEISTKYLALADKAGRTLAMLSEALDRHRGKGQQQITVKHVTVNADQAVVADTVIGSSSGSDEAPNEASTSAVIEATHALGAPLQGTIKAEREAVPIARR